MNLKERLLKIIDEYEEQIRQVKESQGGNEIVRMIESKERLREKITQELDREGF